MDSSHARESALEHYQSVSGLARVSLGVSLVLLITGTIADPDLWGHVRFGLDTLLTHRLPSVDPYSFTSDRPWINHEWLSELLMAIAYRTAGAIGLNVLKLACIAIVVMVVLGLARQSGASRTARDVLVGLTVFATYTRMATVRPQLFSVAIFAIVLLVLKAYDRGRRRVVWLLPICFAAWANLHGGWVLGSAVVAIWFAGTCFAESQWRSRVALLAAGATTIGATLLNPYGAGLWRFLGETVRLERSDISEWHSLFSLPPIILAFEAILPLVAIAAIRRAGARVDRRYLVMVLFLVAGALKVNRLDAFAQAAIAILFASDILAGLDDFSSTFEHSVFDRRIPGAALFGTGLLLIALLVGSRHLKTIQVSGSWIPDRDAARFLQENAAGARLLTWFDWGEYALWELSPSAIRVSLDGRRETVYSSGVVAHHHGFYRAAPGELDYADRIGADAIWLPIDAPVTPHLAREEWRIVFESPRSVVLMRTSRGSSHSARPIGATDPFNWPG